MGDTIAGKEHNMENATATTTTPNFPKDPIHDPAVPMATRRLLAGRRHMCTNLDCRFDWQFGEARPVAGGCGPEATVLQGCLDGTVRDTFQTEKEHNGYRETQAGLDLKVAPPVFGETPALRTGRRS